MEARQRTRQQGGGGKMRLKGLQATRRASQCSRGPFCMPVCRPGNGYAREEPFRASGVVLPTNIPVLSAPSIDNDRHACYKLFSQPPGSKVCETSAQLVAYRAGWDARFSTGGRPWRSSVYALPHRPVPYWSALALTARLPFQRPVWCGRRKYFSKGHEGGA